MKWDIQSLWILRMDMNPFMRRLVGWNGDYTMLALRLLRILRTWLRWRFKKVAPEKAPWCIGADRTSR